MLRPTSLDRVVFELGQVISMLGKQFVDHILDLGKGEHRGCEGVVTDGPVDHDRIAVEGSLDGHFLDAGTEMGHER